MLVLPCGALVDLLIQISWDFEAGIADSNELPIPGFSREAMPLKLERRGQRIDALFKRLRDFAPVAIDPNSTGPFRATSFDPRRYAECANCDTPHISKTFMHPFKNARAIVAPLIAIITADKIRRA